jgi:PadR family transcriptional regulator, regulatory protein AphA
MSVQIYILSKLMEGKNYPYNVIKSLTENLPFNELASMTESKLYYHFESLVKQGLIEEVEIIKESNRPEKQLYEITQKGREELPKKLYKLFERAVSLPEMLTGFIFVQYVDRSRVIQILEQRIEQIYEKSSRITKLHSNFDFEGSNQKVMDIYTDFFKNRFLSEIEALSALIANLKNEQL